MDVKDIRINVLEKVRSDNKPKEKPNFLIIMVDEQRFPPQYENEEIKKWREENLKAQNFLRNNGVEFLNHYANSTACSPSRATIYTGQYPSLHGVTQTDGGGYTAFMPGIFWLDPNTVPTFGDYLRTAGYDTYWKGKWHASHADIEIPGTHNSFLSYNENTGVPIPEKEQIYLNANRLDEYGFDAWIGPEPHGSNPHNSGSSSAVGLSGRDVVYAKDVINLIKQVEKTDKPWAIVASFVNPHDIAIFGNYTRFFPAFNFDVDKSVPPIPKSPTANEDLNTKPRVQASYRDIYPRMIQPLVDTEHYRRLYYSLQLRVDREIQKVLNAIKKSSDYENTIIIYTSDHGDLLGSHGGLFQKWYNAYEESIHVPLIVHNPKLIPKSKKVDNLTSHIDILPTLLNFADVDLNSAMESLKQNHTEVHPPVGKSLVPLILDCKEKTIINEPIYFMTDDDPSKNLNSANLLGRPYEPVTQPSHIETVIVKLPTGKNGELETWKYSRYFDNTQFWSDPGCSDKSIVQHCVDTPLGCECASSIKTTPAADEFEMYNLTKDPIESKNLVNPEHFTNEILAIQIILNKILIQQRNKKRIYPTSGNVPAKPTSNPCGPDFLNV